MTVSVLRSRWQILLRLVEQRSRFIGTGVGRLAVDDFEEGREFVFGGGCGGKNVADVPTLEGHGVGDKGAMAAPGDGLGAHDRGRGRARYFGQSGDAFGELRRGHVVGVAAEGGVAPAGVGGVFVGVASAAEGFQMRVVNVGGTERGRQFVGVELRNVARFRDGTDIDEMFHVVRVQQIEELFDGVGRVTDGE